MVTSTPNLSNEKMHLNESEMSVVEQTPSPPLLLTDSSMNETNRGCIPCSASQHPTRSETQNTIEREEKTAEKHKKRKVVEAESDHNSHSVLILIEAVECDCEEENVVGKKVQSSTSTPCSSREDIVDKGDSFDKVKAKPNTEASIANLKSTNEHNNGTDSKKRHISLAQMTEKRRRDNDENSFTKKGVRRDSNVDRKPKSMKGSNDTRLNESLGAHSAADSSASEAARAQSLENKLLATMQILKNKEETVRVQAESLSLAEARIAALSAKAQRTAHKLHQAQQTHLHSSRSASAGCHIETADVSCAAELQGMDHNIVNKLRDNLSVIEELYRECFYESARQEELITLLRRAVLDMRRTERRAHVPHAQRCSLQRCQDIALEVENLKSEITNFLNSAQNNDSGVWEREECAGDAAEDLRAIAEQLRRLRDMLNTDCTCGLEEENMKLKRINETMEIQIRELRQRVNDLEEALEDKENMNQQYQGRIQEKEQELQHVTHQVVVLEERSREQDNTCDALNGKLKQMEVLLKDKSSELLGVKQQCEAQEATIKELREELNKADLMAQENGQVREEVSCLSAQVAQWREQLAATRRRLRALEAELQRARDHCRHLAAHYRDKAQLAEELQAQLEEAQARGAELCGETRRAVCGVRHWLRRQRQVTREQEEKIKQQDILIQSLQQHGGSKPAEHANTSDNEPCCSKYLMREEARRSDHSFVSASETGCSKCAPRKGNVRASESEMTSSPAPPTPPRRLLRKKPFCGDIRCQWPATREAAAQRPARSHAGVDAPASCDRLSSFTATPTREVSPTDELLERVERAHEALADAHKRWMRGSGGRDVDR